MRRATPAQRAVRTALGNLRRLRRLRGMSATQVGATLNVSPSTVVAHESGARKVRVVVLREYAALYGVSTGDLFDPLLIERVAA